MPKLSEMLSHYYLKKFKENYKFPQLLRQAITNVISAFRDCILLSSSKYYLGTKLHKDCISTGLLTIQLCWANRFHCICQLCMPGSCRLRLSARRFRRKERCEPAMFALGKQWGKRAKMLQIQHTNTALKEHPNTDYNFTFCCDFVSPQQDQCSCLQPHSGL